MDERRQASHRPSCATATPIEYGGRRIVLP